MAGKIQDRVLYKKVNAIYPYPPTKIPYLYAYPKAPSSTLGIVIGESDDIQSQRGQREYPMANNLIMRA
ncbi:hypothetical protein [uncultured Helicobacter sp.]|uniref:hypothetical protein n=1 Tax=uncultured Helicobacter sp. TaxID=175537 RepID=UPI00262559CF|nr:hypothetical protein [uncultured Helicobacter sp.]